LAAMRALVVVNPKATTTSEPTRDVLVHALRADLDVQVVQTTHRGHATEVGRRAAKEGVDLLIALGGDGTVNEAVNGLLEDGPAPDGPALAVVPGGSTNVFARALGMPNDPVEATGQVLDALRQDRRRRVGLSTADGRWFTFCAGMGLDAEVVDAVEQRRERGRRTSGALFVRSALNQFYRVTEREHPGLTLLQPGREPVDGVFLVIVQNTAPWTYLRNRPVNPNPEASFDTGLDVLGLTRLRTVSTLRHVRQLVQPGAGPRGRDVIQRHDVAEVTVQAGRPTALQLDGEAMGERVSVHFRAHPEALTVVV
jgi:diacylglycerol kinase family enzyme